jgi:hypothetical protein
MGNIKMGWDKLRKFFRQAHTWTGQQTFTNINVTGGSISGTVSTELYAASTDPAVNAAVSTAIVDSYNGVVITLTGAGNAQTLQSPTAVTVKRFVVFNDDASGANTVTVNGITLAAGKGQPFVWDGTAWGPTDIGITQIPVLPAQGGTGLATITDHAVMLGSGTGAVTPMAVGATGQVIIGQTGADPIWSNSPTVLSLTLADGGSLVLPVTLATNLTAVGEKITATAGENLVFGDSCYLKSDGKWWKTDADAAATMPSTAMAIATISAAASGLFLKSGYARADSRWAGMTVGADIYASQTAGAFTQTAPTPTTAATVFLQRLGKAPSTNTGAVGIIWYNPDPMVFEVGVDIIDLGTATPSTILFSSMTSVPITWMANHSSDQTITFAAPVASDVGKMFRIVKNGTGAGKVIVDAPAGVFIEDSTDGGTCYCDASARASMLFLVTSATTIQKMGGTGNWTTT